MVFGKVLSLSAINNPLKTTNMKKYFKPKIYPGIEAIYPLSIALETYCEYLNEREPTDIMTEMVMAAKILHAYCLKQKFKGCFNCTAQRKKLF